MFNYGGLFQVGFDFVVMSGVGFYVYVVYVRSFGVFFFFLVMS